VTRSPANIPDRTGVFMKFSSTSETALLQKALKVCETCVLIRHARANTLAISQSDVQYMNDAGLFDGGQTVWKNVHVTRRDLGVYIVCMVREGCS
jgi:hypothetical protein